MRVIEPKRRVNKSKRRRVRRWVRILAASTVCLVLLVGSGGGYVVSRPQAKIDASIKNLQIPKQELPIAWPTIGQAAVGAVGYGLLEEHSDDQARPMASVNKVLTALAVLDKKPLKLGEPGPVITLTADDVARYHDYLAQGGSVAKVALGEQITEYQALQTMLLPSANNMADTLAVWAYGSMEAYLQAANNLAQKIEMTKTKVADAGGLSPSTVSTPSDLIHLGEAAADNDVLASIVAQPTAIVPVQGLVQNLNFLLGKQGINGIKTGNTDEAGGCFLGSLLVDAPNGQKITMLVAVMAAPDLESALKNSLKLIDDVRTGFVKTTVFTAGTVVGYYDVPWQKQIKAVLAQDVVVSGWKSAKLKVVADLTTLGSPVAKGTRVGRLKITGVQTPVQSDVLLADTLAAPTLGWRLRHIVDTLRH